MKKISILVLVLICVVGLVIASYLYFTKDESRQAEIFNDIKETDANYQNPEKNIIEKIISNPPALQSEVNNLGVDVESTSSLKSGTFIKIDPLHYASGKVSIEKFGDNYKLIFQDNFSSAEGPDLYVYLSTAQDFKNIALGGIDTKKTINLGVLKSTNGSQEYVVSKNDFEKYNSAVVIWCKKFGVQFSRADLK